MTHHGSSDRASLPAIRTGYTAARVEDEHLLRQVSAQFGQLGEHLPEVPLGEARELSKDEGAGRLVGNEADVIVGRGANELRAREGRTGEE